MQEKVETLNERLEKEVYLTDRQNEFLDLESSPSKTNYPKTKGKYLHGVHGLKIIVLYGFMH